MITEYNMPAGMRAAAQAAATACLAEVAGVTAVVVASVDGVRFASAAIDSFDATRSAAMASAMVAASSSLAHQFALGTFHCVTVRCDQGFVIVHAVPRPDVDLVIEVVANTDAILTQSMHRIGVIAKLLASVCD